jgi:hypothetical protein
MEFYLYNTYFRFRAVLTGDGSEEVELARV